MTTVRRPRAIKRINPIAGVLATARANASADRPERATAIRDEWEGVIVDTCEAFDTGVWETGVRQGGEEAWKIVEQYKDGSTARAGHRRWVQRLKKTPNLKLEDLDLWGLNRR